MDPNNDGIAVIGMAGRFPGAKNISEFWDNLVNGRETITHFTIEELAGNGLDLETLSNSEHYIKSRGIVENIDKYSQRC